MPAWYGRARERPPAAAPGAGCASPARQPPRRKATASPPSRNGRRPRDHFGNQRRLLVRATLPRVRAASPEMAARWRVARTRHVALEDDAPATRGRVGHGDRRQQRLRVRMLRRARTIAACRRIRRCARDTSRRRASAMCLTTARSCAMKSRPDPARRCRSTSRLITCAWIETSSADTGSSQTISRGSTASARAMPMRWRCPPENSCG